MRCIRKNLKKEGGREGMHSGSDQPLVFCSVRGTVESNLSKSAKDTTVNKMEAEKVVRLSTIPLVSSSYVTASIHLQHPHGTVCVCGVHNMVCGVVLSFV